MEAAAHSDETFEGLLAQLRQKFDQLEQQSRQTTERMQKRVSRMKIKLLSTDQQFRELRRGVEEHCVSSRLLPPVTCGHTGCGTAGIIGCPVFLYKCCYKVASRGIVVKFHVLNCGHCNKGCALVPLLRRLM